MISEIVRFVRSGNGKIGLISRELSAESGERVGSSAGGSELLHFWISDGDPHRTGHSREGLFEVHGVALVSAREDEHPVVKIDRG